MTKHAQQLDELECKIGALEKAFEKRHRPMHAKDDPYRALEGATDPADSEDDKKDDGKKVGRHKFEALVDKIAAERGVSKRQAMTIARKEFPAIYAGFRDITAKSVSYSELLDEQVAKGCSVEAARQRVCHMHPDLARDHITKAAAGVAEFMATVDRVMKRDRCPRTQAMATARKEDPAAFAKFQIV